MKIGYIRVSTHEQNTIRQEVLMESLGVDEVYIDRMSGKNANRPELQRMMEYVRRGDTVIVESISRFARNTRDLLELVERLTAKGVEYILQRQREGIAIAKEQGKYIGRKAIQPPDFERVVGQWHRGEITAVDAMRTLKMSKTTFYRRVKISSLGIANTIC